ncbi:siderophore-interacting protein [Amylibacter sp. SFDW26]|uniref:siderophore-interacting protein n=1 Tax=Amylibacter sp. SFDW26 TaxID=2652722 RepID=UPI00126144AA|nr:siderophore-interacting protein [Amylibacter sp. SFDW26]KAB7613412.1 siderophore-interacting protein [Amylibacter sp. SFDW26]
MTKPKKPAPRILTVKDAFYLTPHMIRVVFQGPELASVYAGCAGANCKIFVPEIGQTRADFEACFVDGPAPVKRTYTVRSFDPDTLEMVIDFVAHGDEGPASAWAMRAETGSFLGFAGPSEVKIKEFYADWYLVAADMSALPVAGAALEAMPRDAKGVAIFEVQSAEDAQDLDVPAGIDVHWLVQANPHKPSTAQEEFMRNMVWPEGVVQTCVAGESGVIKAIRGYFTKERELPRDDVYISGYWKIGLIEDEHQLVKRQEAAAV